jgi:hypothetical protein
VTQRSWWFAGRERQQDLRDRGHCARDGDPRLPRRRLASRGVDDRVQARLVDRGVRDDAEGEGAGGAAAPARRTSPAVADVRPPRAAHAHVGRLQAPTAVPAALDVQGGPRARVPAVDRLRTPLPGPAARAVLRLPPPDGQDRLAAALQPLLGRLADRRVPGRLPRMDATAPVQPLPPKPAWDGGRDGGPDREDRLALPRRRLRVLTARRRQDPVRRIVGPQAPRDQHLHRQGPLAIHRGRRDQQLAGVRERDGLLRYRRRQHVRGGRPHRAAALALAGTRALRAPRVFLRHADDRVRPRVRREHGRHPVRLRRLQRKAAMGPARRQLHLHRGRSLAAPRLRRNLRRGLHGVRRRHGRPDLALPGLLRDPWCAERHRRARLLRRVPAVRPERLSLLEERRPRNLRARREDGTARLALARRRVQPGRRGQPAPLHRRALTGLQLCAEASSRSA